MINFPFLGFTKVCVTQNLVGNGALRCLWRRAWRGVAHNFVSRVFEFRITKGTINPQKPCSLREHPANGKSTRNRCQVLMCQMKIYYYETSWCIFSLILLHSHFRINKGKWCLKRLIVYTRGGQLILLGGHYEKAALMEGHTFLWK